MSLLLAALLQVGPFGTTAPIAAPERAPAARQPASPPAPAPVRERSRLDFCLDLAASNPVDAIDDAEGWRDVTTGPAQAQPLLCLGTALTRLERWNEAEAAFIAGRDAAAAGDSALRGKLGAMAGNAALAEDAPERALGILDAASVAAAASGDLRLIGEIAIDRARALVALKRTEDAAKALVEARTSAADNALAWLLSATLSRRLGKLAEAQAQIATAADLAPRDPEIGLEAGVIAMLAGNEAAARRSWQSAIDAAPQSEAATTARGYLAQLAAPAQAKP